MTFWQTVAAVIVGVAFWRIIDLLSELAKIWGEYRRLK